MNLNILCKKHQIKQIEKYKKNKFLKNNYIVRIFHKKKIDFKALIQQDNDHHALLYKII